VDQSALLSARQEHRVCRRTRAWRGTAGKNVSEPADRLADIGLGNSRVTEHHDAIVAAKAVAACSRPLGKGIDPDARALHQLLESMSVRKVELGAELPGRRHLAAGRKQAIHDHRADLVAELSAQRNRARLVEVYWKPYGNASREPQRDLGRWYAIHVPAGLHTPAAKRIRRLAAALYAVGKRSAALARAFAASSSRSRGGALVTREPSSSRAAAVT